MDRISYYFEFVNYNPIGVVMKNTERFSNRVENYIRYRPHYPKEIINFLKSKIGLTNQLVIADVGAGTGISSEIYLENGNTVYAVEPNKEMREAAEELHKKDRNFISVNATAENTSLKDKSIDLIIVAQAFHWFDKFLAKKEFERIIRSNGHLVLMWNDRNLESHLQQAYEQMLRDFVPEYEEVNYRNMDESTIASFYLPHAYSLETFPNTQHFDFEGLKGRLLSCSYAPLEHEERYKPMMNRLEIIFKEYSVDSYVEFEYSCNLYYGKIG